MEINLSNKQQKIIRKVHGVPQNQVSEVVQKAVDDWYDTLIKHELRIRKSKVDIENDLDLIIPD